MLLFKITMHSAHLMDALCILLCIQRDDLNCNAVELLFHPIVVCYCSLYATVYELLQLIDFNNIENPKWMFSWDPLPILDHLCPPVLEGSLCHPRAWLHVAFSTPVLNSALLTELKFQPCLYYKSLLGSVNDYMKNFQPRAVCNPWVEI